MNSKGYIEARVRDLGEKQVKLAISQFLKAEPCRVGKESFWIAANDIIFSSNAEILANAKKRILKEEHESDTDFLNWCTSMLETLISNTFSWLPQEEIDKQYIRENFASLKECFDYYDQEKKSLEKKRKDLISYVMNKINRRDYDEFNEEVKRSLTELDQKIDQLDEEIKTLKRLYEGSVSEFFETPRRVKIGVSGKYINVAMRTFFKEEKIPLKLEASWN